MAELLGKVEDILQPHLGVAALVADHSHFVIAALDYFCHGAPLPPDIGSGYYLPTEVMQRVRDEVFRVMASSIQVGFGMIWPACQYGFVIYGDDIIVEETQIVVRLPETRIPEEDRGDYIPERLRR
jgi:hypothetical protein